MHVCTATVVVLIQETEGINNKEFIYLSAEDAKEEVL